MANGITESTKMSVPVVTAKRSKTVGTLAVVAGLIAGVVGLVSVLGNNRDILDVLLVVGGLLVSVAGLRMLRRSKAG
jgi:zinc transporter ZupT